MKLLSDLKIKRKIADGLCGIVRNAFIIFCQQAFPVRYLLDPSLKHGIDSLQNYVR